MSDAVSDRDLLCDAILPIVRRHLGTPPEGKKSVEEETLRYIANMLAEANFYRCGIPATQMLTDVDKLLQASAPVLRENFAEVLYYS